MAGSVTKRRASLPALIVLARWLGLSGIFHSILCLSRCAFAATRLAGSKVTRRMVPAMQFETTFIRRCSSPRDRRRLSIGKLGRQPRRPPACDLMWSAVSCRRPLGDAFSNLHLGVLGRLQRVVDGLAAVETLGRVLVFEAGQELERVDVVGDALRDEAAFPSLFDCILVDPLVFRRAAASADAAARHRRTDSPASMKCSAISTRGQLDLAPGRPDQRRVPRFALHRLVDEHVAPGIFR